MLPSWLLKPAENQILKITDSQFFDEPRLARAKNDAIRKETDCSLPWFFKV
jgi:hypothetical protein